MLKVFHCDFHIHTCLSPCAELDMHPRAIVEKALAAKLDVIAICDHNSSENVPYVITASQGKNLKVFPGMEITTIEEVHFVAIFDSMSALESMQEYVYRHLTGENDEKRFGVQAVVNEKGEVEAINEKLLIGATDISLNVLLDYVHNLNGLAIAAHIDRESFSVLSQLGFIDKDMPFDALEVTPFTGLEQARIFYPELENYSFITSSDAHYLKDIGTALTKIMLEEPTLTELKMAFSRQNGRRILE